MSRGPDCIIYWLLVPTLQGGGHARDAQDREIIEIPSSFLMRLLSHITLFQPPGPHSWRIMRTQRGFAPLQAPMGGTGEAKPARDAWTLPNPLSPVIHAEAGTQVCHRRATLRRGRGTPSYSRQSGAKSAATVTYRVRGRTVMSRGDVLNGGHFQVEVLAWNGVSVRRVGCAHHSGSTPQFS